MLAALRGLGGGLSWLGRHLLLLPVVLLWRYVLAPGGRGIAVTLDWLWRWLVVAPVVGLYRYVLTPLGHSMVAVVRGVGAGLAWLGRYLIVVPAVALHRWVLAPVGRGLVLVLREIASAVVVAWRVAGRVTAAVFRFVGRVLYVLLVAPFVGLWRYVLAPVGRVLRDWLWRPLAVAGRAVGRSLRAAAGSVRAALRAARESARATRAEIRRALWGSPRPEAGGAPRSKEREPLP